MPRLPDLDPTRLTPAQKPVYDAIVASPRGRVEGPLRVWLSSPDFAARAQHLGVFCRFGSSLPPRLSELAILVCGAYWQAGYEWWAHAPIGINAGLRAGDVEIIRTGGTPAFAAADETAVHAFAKELVERRRVSQPTYQRAIALLGEKAVVELVGLLGYYTIISMTINAFEVPLPPGEREPFADLT